MIVIIVINSVARTFLYYEDHAYSSIQDSVRRKNEGLSLPHYYSIISWNTGFCFAISIFNNYLNILVLNFSEFYDKQNRGYIYAYFSLKTHVIYSKEINAG